MKKAIMLALMTVLMVSMLTAGIGTADTGNTSGDQDSQYISGGSEEEGNLVYGTATLTFAEFYSGDVTNTDSYDAVSSATSGKHSIMANMATDYVDESTNADGYHITGVANVNIAIADDELEAYQAINPTFMKLESEPAQYKRVVMENGTAVYSGTKFNVADTVTDATAELVTGSNWGDYQINVSDGATTHLRNSREDEFDINSNIQGIILETESGLKVGMEYLQSIWVQPYEVSWNVAEDNSHNTHIAAFDNLGELSKLTGETVTRITYIMPDCAYVYEFDGIYIKPIYAESITATTSVEYDAITLSRSDFAEFENGTLSVTYTLGTGRDRQVTTLLSVPLADGVDSYALDLSAISGLEQDGVYEAKLSSDSYADITIALPSTDAQRITLEALLDTAAEKLAEDPGNDSLQAHIAEGEALRNDADAASSEVGSLIGELTQLTSDEQQGDGNREGHRS